MDDAGLDTRSSSSRSIINNSDMDVKEEDLASVHDGISSESSFCGDSELKASYEDRAQRYNPKEYWDVVQWNIQHLAARDAKRLLPPHGTKRKRRRQQQQQQQQQRQESSTPPTQKIRRVDETDDAAPAVVDGTAVTKYEWEDRVRTRNLLDRSVAERPYNPYEGDSMAKQLDESADQFLDRLLPSTTKVTGAAGGPWIFVANPYSAYRPTNEDVATFKQKGFKVLSSYLERRKMYEEKYPNKGPTGITKMLRSDKVDLEAQIVELAKEHGVTSGKWMLFRATEVVDEVWRTITNAVLENKLGPSAKVTTGDEDANRSHRLVYIYTADFSDVPDVKRVLQQIQKLNLLQDNQHERSEIIYYKCDAYTHLDIANGNQYKLKASMYNSKDLVFQIE